MSMFLRGANMKSFKGSIYAKFTILTFMTSIMVLFQNCSQTGFSPETLHEQNLASLSQDPTATDLQCVEGQTRSGYLASSALFPKLCGQKSIQKCVNGNWDSQEILYSTCMQQCVHPTTQQAVNVGEFFYSFSAASGSSQSACDAVQTISTCDAKTGKFMPTPSANLTCLVQGQTCAYTNGMGIAVPTGNAVNSTVKGYIASSATYPTLCASQVTRTCQSNGSWNGSTPVYSSCLQKCKHPDSNQPVDASSTYVYYTIQSGTSTQCTNAKVTSTCQSSSGLFSPTVATSRFASCTITGSAPVISSFTASSLSITSGQSTTISWVTTGATSLTLNPGSVNVTGKTSLVVSPTANTTYQLVATNSSGSVNSSMISVILLSNQPPTNSLADSVDAYAPWPLEIISSPREIAYPDLRYETRLAVIGGIYPYSFAIVKGPNGMVIDSRTGRIVWTPSTSDLGQSQIQISVTDQINNQVSQNFNLNVTTSGFYFISETGRDSTQNDGTIAKPWKTLEYAYSQNLAESAVYVMRGGNYLMSNNFSLGNNKPCRVMAYPNEMPKIDFNKTGSFLFYGCAVQGLIEGLELFNQNEHGINLWNPAALTSNSKGIAIVKNYFHDLQSYAQGENPAFIFSPNHGTNSAVDDTMVSQKVVAQDNLFKDVHIYNDYTWGSNSGATVFFDVHKSLIEDNKSIDTGRSAFTDKHNSYYNTYRGNKILPSTGAMYEGVVIAAQARSESVQVHHNLFVNAGVQIGQQTGYVKNIYVHHNSFVNGGVGSNINMSLAESQNYVIKYNLFTNETGYRADPAFRGGFRIDPAYCLNDQQLKNSPSKFSIDKNLFYSSASILGIEIIDISPNQRWRFYDDARSLATMQSWGFELNSVFSLTPLGIVGSGETYGLPTNNFYYGIYGHQIK